MDLAVFGVIKLKVNQKIYSNFYEFIINRLSNVFNTDLIFIFS